VTSGLRWAGLAGLLAAPLLAAALPVDKPDADIDPMRVASTASPRATTSLMTAVTRAGERLVAVGERGIVLTSDDGGEHWVQRLTPVSVLLTAVAFSAARHGWAVGHSGIVLTTGDGGATWTRQLDGRAIAQLVLDAARQQAQAQPGEAAERALASAQRLVDDGPDKPLLAVEARGDTVIIVGAYGLALRSTDGGATWHDLQARIPNRMGAHLYAICRTGETLLLAGEQGSVFRSTDGGMSFRAVQTPYGGSYFGALAPTPDHLFVFGLQGHAYASEDGGATWTESHTDSSAALSGGTMLDDGSLLLVSQAGQLLRSTDRGLNFHLVPVGTPLPFVDVVEAGNGQVALAGARGMTQVTLPPAGKRP